MASESERIQRLEERLDQKDREALKVSWFVWGLVVGIAALFLITMAVI